MSVKEWDLPAWAVAQAAAAGLTLDQHGARALVATVGNRQARLLREIEKLALECGPGARLDADGVAQRVGRSAERKAWTLADAVVARDAAAATRIFLQLRAQGERVESLSYWVTRRLREALTVARRLEQGAPASALRGELRMPPKAAAVFGALRRAICALADLELDSRGGSALDGDTLALRTIEAITA
jgi:DNA polymerase-3 subunit delta